MIFQEKILKNGLKLILAPLSETKAVTILALVPVGSRYETKENNGVSHFIEHLMFKGTERRPSTLTISKELDGVGASFNAFTGKEYTGYYIKINSQKLELGLDILSDILFNSLFKEEEIQRERGVILEEIKMYEDNPLLYIDDLFEQTIYQGNPLGWSIAGPGKVIKKISRKEIIDFKNKFYQPRKILLTLAGQFPEKQTIKLINQYFRRGRKATKLIEGSCLKFQTKSHQIPQINLREQKTEQIQIALGFPAYSYFHPKIYALTLLSIILGGNMSSRLFINVRERKGLAYYIKAEADSYQDIGNLSVWAGVGKENLFKALKIILKELKKVKSKQVSKKELDRAKEFIQGKLILALEDSANIADWCGKQELLTHKILTPEQKMKNFFKVTAQEIQQVANNIIKQNQLNFALIGEFKDKDNLLKVLKV